MRHLTLRNTFVLVLLLGIFIMTLRPIADPDFWWHLKTGQLIAQSHAIPHTDPFSFTLKGQPWVTHEWLAEVILYGLYRLGGYGLLIATFSAIITAAFLLAYKTTAATSRPYVAGFVLLLGALASAPTWGVRPQMLSLFFTSGFLFCLDRFHRTGRTAFLVPLPLATILWVNLHAGYLLGLAIVGIAIFGELVELGLSTWKSKTPPPASSFRPALLLSAALGLSIAASLANPNGYRILLYPFQTLTSPSMQQFIQEWFSPDFHMPEWQPLALLILALIGAGALGKRTVRPTNLILLLALGYEALHSMRNVPLFALVAIPVLTDELDALVRIPIESRPAKRMTQLASAGLLIILFLAAGLRLFQTIGQQAKTEADNFPKAAVEWIQANSPPGKMFNSYGWGGYLIWKLAPIYPVYIDGRADVYGDKFIFTFVSTEHGEPGWSTTLDSQGVNLVLVDPTSGLANVLRDAPDWKIAYQDNRSIVFLRR